MGYCYHVPFIGGGAEARWIDGNQTWVVKYSKGALGATNKAAACADVRRQFCSKFGKRVCNGVRICEADKCLGQTATKCYSRADDIITGGHQCAPGEAANITQQNTQRVQTRNAICDKECGFLDFPCMSAKLQNQCGGFGLGTDKNCFGMGVPCWTVGLVAGLVLLFVLKS